jgi:serine phosphatase RsbU (regulator of sigma subunit)
MSVQTQAILPPIDLAQNPAAWKEELEKASSRFHIMGAWVAIIFDPIFAITDYLNIPDSWAHLLIIRLMVSFVTLMTLLLQKPLKLPSFFIVLVPFTLISLQNAYTFSLITPNHVLGHSLNYMALLVGGGMFLLWHWSFSVGVIVASGLATWYFITHNPELNFEDSMVQGGLLLYTVGIFMIVLIKARYDLTLKEIKARLGLKYANQQLSIQKGIIEKKNKNITDSIKYAQRIQASFLGNTREMIGWFHDAFILFQPKDIVSGDFYWFQQSPRGTFRVVVAADCTGHGVPGAFMTVMGNDFLNEIVGHRKIYAPEAILQALDEKVMGNFSKTGNDQHKIQDGMDMSILVFEEHCVHFAGAKNPLYHMRNGEIRLIKGSKFPIGSSQYPKGKVFERHTLETRPGDRFFIFSDGYTDQFGGEKNMKFMNKRFMEILLQTQGQPMEQVREALLSAHLAWKEGHSQTDDILVIGISV